MHLIESGYRMIPLFLNDAASLAPARLAVKIEKTNLDRPESILRELPTISYLKVRLH